MSTLTLVRADARTAPARPPVVVGEIIRVPETIRQPSDRTLRRGSYQVLAVELTPKEHLHLGSYRLVVEATPECKSLPKTHRPGSAYRKRKGVSSRPVCAQKARFYLYPGDFIRIVGDELATGAGLRSIPDHPLQND